jgi:DNA-binding SARP family transcriptional activator
VSRIDVDVETYLADVTHARRLGERGATAQAYALLTAADRRRRDDVFSDDPYADWAQPLREEARAAHVEALRLLATTAGALGDPAAAVAYLVRLLAIDPYDEQAHSALVDTHLRAGQHGEARRTYRRYREAMAAIGVHPAPRYQRAFQYQEPMHTPNAVAE